MPKPVLV